MSAGGGRGAAATTLVNVLTVPPNFSYVEETIARCWRLSDAHVPFLRASSVGSVINVSGTKLDYAVEYYCKQEADVAVHDLFAGGPSPLSQSVASVEAFVKRALELALSLAVSAPTVLLVGSEYNLDNVVVACLRLVQEWSFVSIVGELRMNSGCRHFDVEQFVEHFDPDTVDVARHTPEFLHVHFRVKEEEIKLLQRLGAAAAAAAAATAASSGGSSSSSSMNGRGNELGVGAETGAVGAPPSPPKGSHCPDDPSTDEALRRIFFSDKLVSPGYVYDPSVSLINDKDDDD